MPQKKEAASADPRSPSRRTSSAGRGARIARSFAQTTLFAAGIAATRIGSPEIDPQFQVFDPTLVDRLQAPITRYHE